MSEDIDPAQWARDHKKAFVDKLIEPYLSTVEDPPSAFFMAGLPGAGKTEFTRGLISGLDPRPLRLDMDEIASQIDSYEPQIADKYRKGATILLENAFSISIKMRLSFVMDGTFGSPKAIQNINRCIRHGYLVKVIYLYQDPKVAWNFTLAREKVEHRAISMSGFINSYFNVLQNLRTLLDTNLDSVDIDVAVKDINNIVGEYFNNVDRVRFDELVKQDYNRISLERYING